MASSVVEETLKEAADTPDNARQWRQQTNADGQFGGGGHPGQFKVDFLGGSKTEVENFWTQTDGFSKRCCSIHLLNYRSCMKSPPCLARPNV